MNLAAILDYSRAVLALRVYKVDLVLRRKAGAPIEESHISVHGASSEEDALNRAHTMCRHLGWILEAPPVLDLHPAFHPPAEPEPEPAPDVVPLGEDLGAPDVVPLGEDLGETIDVPAYEDEEDSPDVR